MTAATVKPAQFRDNLQHATPQFSQTCTSESLYLNHQIIFKTENRLACDADLFLYANVPQIQIGYLP